MSSKMRVVPSEHGSSRRPSFAELSAESLLYRNKPLALTLRTRSNRINETADDVQYQYELRKSKTIQFIQDNFKRKECVHFVPKVDAKKKTNGSIVCHCGEAPERHIKGTIGIPDYYSQGMSVLDNDLGTGKVKDTWNIDDDARVFPTNAFGKIDFLHEGLGGRKPSKFVRVMDDTPIDLVLTLMKEHWQMDSPKKANLAITVIGGAKNFKLDGKKKEVFNRGLVEAAQTTNAWIITSGCNMGIMKDVGDAVSEAQSYNWDKHGMTHTLRCIGIAPWGYVERRSVLVSNDSQGSWNAQYKVNNIIRHLQPVPLNHNHTHFILVDDGMRNRYGGVANFRARLEKKLCSPTNPKDGNEPGEGIPVVLVLVEGGFDAIDDVLRSLHHHIPVLVCEGTGRAADILAYAFTHTVTTRSGERKMNEKHKPILEDKLVTAFGKTWASRSDVHIEATKYTRIVLECCQNENLITVFDMNKNEEFDLAILSALLKGQGAVNIDQLRDQLKLAFTWNRSDIAEEKIFNQNVEWPPGSLDEIMTDALVEDKVNFVKLLLQNGVIMSEYLTIARLRHLYNSAPRMSHLRLLLSHYSKFQKYCLNDVAQLLRKLIGHHHDTLYEEDNDINKVMAERIEDSDRKCFEKPFRELFLWSILMNRHDMAKFLWERCHESIPSALAASAIYRALAVRVAHYDDDLRVQYQMNKDEFEILAMKVLDECHNTDPEKASMLVEMKYPTWGDVNCLEMAADAHCEEFLSSACCQNTLDLMWKKGILSHWIGILLAIVFPFLVVVRVRYMHDTITSPMSASEKIHTFFNAPAVKFASNVMMYVFFLCLYCYMILFSFRHEITTIEWIVIGWMATLLLEELREMFFRSKSGNIITRVSDWWKFSYFNRIDFAIILLAILGFILRFVPDYFIGAKTVYAINCVFLFVRILRDYSASSFLGPKLVMITRMLQELILYMMIMAVFLLAYGVSSLSLMYPVRDFYGNVFRDMFYYPYWQIYGELYLEELEGRTDDCLGNSTIRADGTPCPTFSWLIPVLTALYLLFGNLLLLNILIAIFNNVFNEIQTNSFRIWKFGLYFLVIEYDQKPRLAPPFIIFEHIYLLFRWIFCSSCCKTIAVVEETSKSSSMLEIFAKEMVRNFLLSAGRRSLNKSSTYLETIKKRVEEMSKTMEEERLLEQRVFEAEQNKLIADKGDTPRPTLRRGVTKNFKLQDSASSLAAAMKECGYNVPEPPETPVEVEKPKILRKKASFSRWPSMRALMSLKNKELQVEKKSEEKAIKETSDDENAYDDLNFDLLRRTQSAGAYARITPRTPEMNAPFPPLQYQSSVAWEQEQEQEKQAAEERKKQINEAVQSVNDRLEKLEQRMEAMEESSRSSLYNIEALLRNAVFSTPQRAFSRQVSRSSRRDDF